MSIRSDSLEPLPNGRHRNSIYDNDFVSEATRPNPKRLVICCDGTWQSAVSLDPKQGCPSNVARLSRVLAGAGKDKLGKEWQQVVYYDAGVGTGDLTWLERSRQGGTGIGLLENVIEAYNFIVNNFNPGDELYFFGFSRGAFTVRATAGLVCELGIIEPASMRSFLKLYNDYIHAEHFESPFIEFSGWTDYITECGKKGAKCYNAASEEVSIKVIGVWDTVGALGVPDVGHLQRFNNSPLRQAFQYHDVELHKQIEHAYQALALDEQRRPFAPSVWTQRASNQTTRLCQCWFPGAHVQIGGGSEENADPKKPQGDGEQLASVSYAWMLDRIQPFLALDPAALEFQKSEILDNVKAFSAVSSSAAAAKSEGAFAGLKKWFQGSGKAQSAARHVDSATGKLPGIADSHSWMYDVLGFPEARKPGENNRTGHGVPEEERQWTVERVHPSVFQRQEMSKATGKPYMPESLKGWERIEEEHGTGKNGVVRRGWKWVKYQTEDDGKTRVKDEQGNDVLERNLWEFEIAEMPEGKSVEQWVINNLPFWNKELQKEVQAGWQN